MSATPEQPGRSDATGPGRRAQRLPTTPIGAGAEASLAEANARLLIVSIDPAERQRLAATLACGTTACEQADSIADALAAASTSRFDLAIIPADLPGGAGYELSRALTEIDESLGTVMLAGSASLDDAVRAMRAGALDLIVGNLGPAELRDRIAASLRRARAARERADRLRRLANACRELNDAREGMASQVGSLCDDLAGAYQELSEQITHVGEAAEFNSLVRQELDLEALLRTVLEFILAKIGPTNAAVYLPSTSGDYSLGAYVNYDCPRDSTEVLLEHLAGVIAPRFERTETVELMAGEDDLHARLGDDADWIAGNALACFSCRQDGECLAVVALFRERRTGFNADAVRLLATIADLFGRQLARVIHVHHRHLPKDTWGLPGAADDDDIDLAA
ncbi:MAG: response regulator [Phycisphaeraceae bacterium]|nr:response regulator [Phycisphaeraceae bacterium]